MTSVLQRARRKVSNKSVDGQRESSTNLARPLRLSLVFCHICHHTAWAFSLSSCLSSLRTSSNKAAWHVSERPVWHVLSVAHENTTDANKRRHPHTSTPISSPPFPVEQVRLQPDINLIQCSRSALPTSVALNINKSTAQSRSPTSPSGRPITSPVLLRSSVCYWESVPLSPLLASPERTASHSGDHSPQCLRTPCYPPPESPPPWHRRYTRRLARRLATPSSQAPFCWIISTAPAVFPPSARSCTNHAQTMSDGYRPTL